MVASLDYKIEVENKGIQFIYQKKIQKFICWPGWEQIDTQMWSTAHHFCLLSGVWSILPLTKCF